MTKLEAEAEVGILLARQRELARVGNRLGPRDYQRLKSLLLFLGWTKVPTQMSRRRYARLTLGAPKPFVGPGGEQMQEHAYHDETGRELGVVRIHPRNDGRTLHVHWVGPRSGTATGEQAHSVGVGEVRSLVPQLRQHYPDAEFLTGIRSEGAHANNPGRVMVPLRKMARRHIPFVEINSLYRSTRHRSGLNNIGRELQKMVAVHADRDVRALAAAALRNGGEPLRQLQDRLTEIGDARGEWNWSGIADWDRVRNRFVTGNQPDMIAYGVPRRSTDPDTRLSNLIDSAVRAKNRRGFTSDTFPYLSMIGTHLKENGNVELGDLFHRGIKEFTTGHVARLSGGHKHLVNLPLGHRILVREGEADNQSRTEGNIPVHWVSIGRPVKGKDKLQTLQFFAPREVTEPKAPSQMSRKLRRTQFEIKNDNAKDRHSNSENPTLKRGRHVCRGCWKHFHALPPNRECPSCGGEVYTVRKYERPRKYAGSHFVQHANPAMKLPVYYHTASFRGRKPQPGELVPVRYLSPRKSGGQWVWGPSLPYGEGTARYHEKMPHWWDLITKPLANQEAVEYDHRRHQAGVENTEDFGGAEEPEHHYARPRKYLKPRRDFIDALRRIRSSNQNAIHKVANQLAGQLGLRPIKVLNALHDSPQGSTPGVAQAVYGDASPEAIHQAANWIALNSNSPGIGVFHYSQGGPDTLYRIRHEGSGLELRSRLDRFGLRERVLIPHKKGFDVLIPDKGSKLGPAVQQFAAATKSVPEESRGLFHTVGASDQGDARAKFRDRIAAGERRQSSSQETPPEPPPEPTPMSRNRVRQHLKFLGDIRGDS